MEELITNMNAQMAELPAPVQIWMNWMMVIFMASIFFIWNHKLARWVLATIFLSMPLAMLVFYLSNTVHLIGIVHILLWTPLIYYFYKFEYKTENFKLKSLYGVWVSLLMSTILISMLFDIRDITLVSMGLK